VDAAAAIDVGVDDVAVVAGTCGYEVAGAESIFCLFERAGVGAGVGDGLGFVPPTITELEDGFCEIGVLGKLPETTAGALLEPPLELPAAS